MPVSLSDRNGDAVRSPRLIVGRSSWADALPDTRKPLLGLDTIGVC